MAGRSSDGLESAAGRTIQAVDRALAILELLATEPGGLGLMEIAERLGIKHQTALGLLRTLQARGYVVQAGRGGAYLLGPGAARLAMAAQSTDRRAALAQPIVEELGRRSGESAFLAELRGEFLVPLASAACHAPLSAAPEPIAANRLHAMATGKVVLAQLSADERDGLLGGARLARLGPRTITSRQELLRELERVKRQGYAVCRDEWAEGVAAIAVPVPAAGPPAAVGVSLPTARFTPARARELLQMLRRAAEQIAELWGK